MPGGVSVDVVPVLAGARRGGQRERAEDVKVFFEWGQ